MPTQQLNKDKNMRLRKIALTGILLILPLSAFAGESGFFAGIDVSGGTAHGRSSTKNGGGDAHTNTPGAGGIVENVKFKDTTGIGGHVGYRFNESLATFITYQHMRGNVSWDADYPTYGGGVASSFDGRATSNILMGNVAYEWALTQATSLRASAGLGVAYNSLSNITEINKPDGAFVSKVANHREVSPAAQIGAGLRHKVSSNIALGLDVLVSYTGGFETGVTRSGNIGVTRINAYKINDVWRANLGASLTFSF